MDDLQALNMVRFSEDIKAQTPAAVNALENAAKALAEKMKREAKHTDRKTNADENTEGPDGNVRLTESDLVADLRLERAAAQELREKIDALSKKTDEQRMRAREAEDRAYDMRVEMLNIAELCCEMQGTMRDAETAPTVKLQECERTLLAIRKIAYEYTGS
jgi:hypothetical protein